MTARLKVIYDTDPGVDDAMALLLLARHPRIELIGVTTVFGNATIDTTTRNALYLKQAFGFSAPVARGAAKPINAPVAAAPVTFVHGDNGLGDIPLPAVTARADPRPAARLIAELVRANPGAVTIIAVGRMTNLALAIAADPGIVPLVKALVVMGGAFGRNGHTGNVTPVAEANIIGDATAADVVFGADWPLTIVGLDVTQQTVMSDAYMRALAAEAGRDGQFLFEVSRFYADFYTSTGQTSDGFYVHDSSAVAYALHPELFTLERGPVRVIREGIAEGQTILRPEKRFDHARDWDGRPAVNVCVGVDSAAFLDFYRRTITGTV
jgi:inosine-uridine nucleoside N-ribohydrolase